MVYSFVSVFAKIASGQDSIKKTLLFMFIELCFLGIYALVWQQVLKKFPLVVALSSKGVTVIFALVWSVLLFHERISIQNILGAAMIVLGIGLVSADD